MADLLSFNGPLWSGDAFYQPPREWHIVTSDAAGAKTVVFRVLPQGQPMVVKSNKARWCWLTNRMQRTKVGAKRRVSPSLGSVRRWRDPQPSYALQETRDVGNSPRPAEEELPMGNVGPEGKP